MRYFRRRARSYGVRRRFRSRFRRARMRARSMGRFKRRKSAFPQKMKRTGTLRKHYNTVPWTAPKKRVHHRYVQTAKALNPGDLITFVGKIYRLDNLYDPDPAFGGVSAFGYDTMALSYQRYAVIATQVTVRFQSADDSNSQYVAIRPIEPLQTPAYGIQAVLSQGRTISALLPPRAVSPPLTLQYRCSPPKFSNVTDPLENTLTLFATATDNSSVGIEVLCGAATTQAALGCWFDIEIDYIAIWVEPNTFATA